MALEMKATSRWWYARFLVNGRLRRFPLMEMKGGKEQRLGSKVDGLEPEAPGEGERPAFMESYLTGRGRRMIN